jgi:hypothetical protein
MGGLFSMANAAEDPANAAEYLDDDAMLQRYHTNLSERVPRIEPRPLGNEVALSPGNAAMVDTWPQQVRIKQYAGSVRGECTNFMTPLMYILLGDFFDSYQYKNRRVNCMIYALDDLDVRLCGNFFGQERSIIDAIEHIFTQPLFFDMFSSTIGVRSDKPPRGHTEILRRCITFGFQTFFTGIGLDGHNVALMIQREATGPIEVVLVDSVPIENYRYKNVHKIILDTAQRGIEMAFRRRGFLGEIVLVKSTLNTQYLLKYKEPDLECISMAFRACIYLHIVGDYRNMSEPPRAFRDHLLTFKRYMDRMTTWIHTEPLIISQRAVPVVSFAMTQSFWIIDTRYCYLVLMAPMVIPEALVGVRERMNYLYSNHVQYIDFLFSPNSDQIFTKRREMTPDKSICVTSSGYKFLY